MNALLHPTTTSNNSPADSHPKVLVIEDDEFQRVGLVAQLMTHKIHNVCAVQNAEEALDLLKDSGVRYDITLCDIQLHDMDGIAFLQTADANRLGKIILLSALPVDIQLATRRVLRQHGIALAGCLPKPLNWPQFQHVLQTYEASAPAGQTDQAALPRESWSRSELAAALESDQFLAFFQPLITLESHALHGLECLSRWQHPTYGLLTPDTFLADVIAHGLIDDFTWKMLDYSLALQQNWSLPFDPPRISVNVSASSLRDARFAAEWKHRVTKAGVSAGKIMLELTETELTIDDSALLEVLTKLRIHGFGVALDDFGAGYTSLQQLRYLPVTELKIDRSLVTRTNRTGRGAILLDAVIYMANELSMSSVAEGVETVSDAEFLRDLGCQAGQGYYFARPMPVEKLRYWLQGSAGNTPQ